MGANYDFIITSETDIVKRIEAFLLEKGLKLRCIVDLESIDIADDKVILIGPSKKGFVQVVANSSALGVDLAQWYDCNPLATYFSQFGETSFHIWSLDSGFVAGYSAYDNGKKVKSDHIFSRHAINTKQLMESVPTPQTQSRDILQNFLQKDKSAYLSEWKQMENRERGMACIIAEMGFDTHLVDLFDALDDQQGVVVAADCYGNVELSGWKVIVFDTFTQSPL